MVKRVAAGPAVVPLEAPADVVRNSDVVTQWIGIAADDVHDALLDSVHAVAMNARIRPAENGEILLVVAVSMRIPLTRTRITLAKTAIREADVARCESDV